MLELSGRSPGILGDTYVALALLGLFAGGVSGPEGVAMPNETFVDFAFFWLGRFFRLVSQ